MFGRKKEKKSGGPSIIKTIAGLALVKFLTRMIMKRARN